jgi:four helix bundle protein
MERKGSDLEQRLIDFAVSVLKLSEMLPRTYAGNYYAGQMIRSGSSSALQYGEARAAESRKDFIHKMKGSLKELRETYINLRVVQKMEWLDSEITDPVIYENNELISIFVKSINTAQSNNKTNELNN